MSTDILTDGDYSGIASVIILPVEGVTAFHTFGGSAAAGRANLADPASPLVDVGVPVVSGSFVSLDSAGNAYQSASLEVKNMTFFAVARTGANTTARIVSNAPSTGLGLTMYFTAASQIAASALFMDAGVATQKVVTLGVPDKTTWRLYAARVKEGTGIEIFDLTRNDKATQAFAGARSLAATALRVGMRAAPTAGGEFDLAHVSFAAHAMTDEEIAAHAAFIRSEMTYQAAPIAV